VAKLAIAIGMGVAFGALGFFTGGAGWIVGMTAMQGMMIGASAGMAIGGVIGNALFPMKLPTNAQPPLVTSGATNGVPIPFGYGSYRFAGNIIWSPGLQEVTVKESVGGKGGATQSTITYTASFAVAFGEGPGDIVKIWFDSKIGFDITSGTNTATYINTTNDNNATLYPVPTFYTGTQTQMPDPLVQATVGVNACSAFRPLIYCVYETLSLLNFGNRIPNIQALIQYKQPWSFGGGTFSVVGTNTVSDGNMGNSNLSTSISTTTTADNQYVLALQTTYCTSSDPFIGGTPLHSTIWGSEGIQSEFIVPAAGTVVTQACANLCMGAIGWTGSQWVGGMIIFPSTPTYIQHIATGNTYTQPFPSDVTAGNSILVIIQSGLCTDIGSGFTLSDTQGNSYQQLFFAASPPGYFANFAYLGAYIAYNVVGGPNTVNISTVGTAFSNLQPNCIEISVPSAPQTYQTAIIPGVLSVDSGSAVGQGTGDNITTAVQAPTNPQSWLLQIIAAGSTATSNHPDSTHNWHSFDNSLDGYGGIGSFVMPAAVKNLDVSHTQAYANCSGGNWAAAVFSFSLIGSAIPSIVQKVSQIAPLAPPHTFSFTSNTTDNNTIIVVNSSVGLTGNADARLRLTDSQDNIYQQVHIHQASTSVELDVWITQNVIAGPNTFTLTGSNTSTSRNTTAYEIQAGSYPSASLDSVITDICERSGLDSSQIDVTRCANIPITGYLVTAQGDGKSALQTPMAAHFIDAAESDFVLKFIPRGTESPVMTIPEADLGLVADKAKLTETIVQQQELPKEIDVVFIDPTIDYQQNKTQKMRSSRTVKTKQIVAMNLPLLLTPTQARQIAEKALIIAYVERKPYDMNLWKMAYAVLDPTDVVNFIYEGATYQARIVTAGLGVGYSVTLSMVSEAPSTYLSVATGGVATGVIPQTGLPLVPSVTFLYDLPYLQDSDASTLTGFYWGLSGADSSWPGGVLYKSSDDLTFNPLASSTGHMTYGTTVGTLGNPPMLWAWDMVNSLTITPLYGTLSGTTDLAVLNGANALIVGGELIQYVNAVLNMDGTYTVSRLLRGRRNTEYAAYGHGAGEAVVDPLTGLQHATSPITLIGLERFYRGVTIGQDVTAVTDTDLTLSGNDLKPAAPVHLTGTRDGSFNLTIGWSRRTRYGGEWTNGTAYVPLNEVSEAYQINILSGITIKRSITWVSGTYDTNGIPTCSYTAAQQITDFGSTQSNLSVVVYQISSQVGLGFPGLASI